MLMTFMVPHYQVLCYFSCRAVYPEICVGGQYPQKRRESIKGGDHRLKISVQNRQLNLFPYPEEDETKKMPSDGSFGCSILVAGRPVPEYVHGGRVYVESNLHTPFSYNQQMVELVNGEKEIQMSPVTPYQVFVHLAPHCETSALFIYVDGVRVTKLLLEKAQSKIIGGFEEKGGVREFLFALPRYAKDQHDTVEEKRRSKIGTIEVVRYDASYVKEEYRPIRDIKFDQANKKDAVKVTAGKYTMSTTKKGRYIHRAAPYDVQLKKLWRIGPECGRLTLNYRMGHSMEEMGIELRPTDWSRVIVRKSSCTPPGSPPITPTGSPQLAPQDKNTSTTDSTTSTTDSSTSCAFESSRSSSPSSPLDKDCSKNIINFTSTEIKHEKDLVEEPQISPIHLIATN